MRLKISKNLIDAMEKENNKANNYLKPAGDLSSSNKKANLSNNWTEEEIKTYLKSITSGIEKNNVFEFGEGVISAGTEIVPIDSIVKMVDLGYNIISTKYYNPDMIEVKYQEIIKKGRGR